MNVNFVRKFAISNVVDVVHMSMNIGARIWCHAFGKIRPNPKGGFWVLVCLVKSVFQVTFGTPMYPSLVICYFP